MIQIIDDVGSLHIILYSRSGYINDHIKYEYPLSADRYVQQNNPTPVFCNPTALSIPIGVYAHAWVRITLTMMKGSPFYNDTTNLSEVYKILKLLSVSKGTRGGHNRVTKR